MYKGKQAYYVPAKGEKGKYDISGDELTKLIDRDGRVNEDIPPDSEDKAFQADLKAMKPDEAPAAKAKPFLATAKKTAKGEVSEKAMEDAPVPATPTPTKKQRIVGGVDTKTGKRVTPQERRRKLEAYSDKVRSGKMPKKDLIDLYFGLADIDEENLSNVDIQKFGTFRGKKDQHIADRVMPNVLLNFAQAQGLREGGLIDALEGGNPSASSIKQYMKNKGISQGDFFRWYLSIIKDGRKAGEVGKQVRDRLDAELEPLMMAEKLGKFVNK
jgi:hypothetical protein